MSTPTPTTRKRRSEDELIAELQAKIADIEKRKRLREVKASPLVKDFERFRKHADRFIQACADEDRTDISNSVLALLNTVERQVHDSGE